MKVAITAVGGGIGQSIIKALHRTEYRSVGIDPRPDAAGLYLAECGYLGKDVDDPKYIDSLLKICKKEECKFLFPGLDSELMPLSKNVDRFKEIGTIPIVSKPSTIELSDDKWKLYKFLQKNNFPHIDTGCDIEDAIAREIKLPWILKPMVGGCRSKKVILCKSVDEAREMSCRTFGVESFIVQEYIEGEEYTCGSLTFSKQVIGTIQMKRTLRHGDTYKAYVTGEPKISTFLNKLLPALNPFGPCNIQLRLRNSIPYILEINARCSGTTGARALAGFNEPVLTCDYLRNQRVNYTIKEIAIFRYWNECIADNDAIKELKNEGSIHRSKWGAR